MDLTAFADSPAGTLVPISGYDGRFQETFETVAFLPRPLPAVIHLDPETIRTVTDASTAVARLDQAAVRLPNPMLLARPAIRREAVSTSALEGTYAAFTDVLEADLVGDSDTSTAVSEVINYVRTAEAAYEWIKDRPMTIGMLEALHRILVRGARGDTTDAGQIRTIQVCIGAGAGRIAEARFIPPPPGDQLRAGLEEWQRWINAVDANPLVVKMAMGHYQFETLHPFNDGNGRLGRLICVLQLLARHELRVPVLNLSPWLEPRRREYQDELLRCGQTGRFNDWIRFFSEAVRAQSVQAVERIDALEDWRAGVLDQLRRAGVRGAAVTITNELIGYPLISPTVAAKAYGISYPAANTAIRRLESIGILHERTGRRYGRIYAARDVLRIIDS